MFELTVSKDTLNVFLEEFAEQLQDSERLILELEKVPKPETIQALFRIMHSIKGASSSIGHEEMARLAHAMETSLDGVRAGKTNVSRSLIDAFIQSLDALRSFQRGIQTGSPDPPHTEELIQKLESISQSSPSTAEKPGISGDIAVDLEREIKSIRTIRVDVELFDRLVNEVGELVIGKTRLAVLGEFLKDREAAGTLGVELADCIHDLGKIIGGLQDEVMKARLLPIDVITSKFPRMIRDLCLRFGKEITFTVEGEQTNLDRTVVEEILDPLIHLLRNAVDHGIESPEARVRAGKPRMGRIGLRAAHKENHVVVEIEDDGCGIDTEKIFEVAMKRGILSKDQIRGFNQEELIDLIFSPGFSTAGKVSEVSGRGVGLDVVKERIQRIGGTVKVYTKRGKGTRFYIEIPFSLAILKGLTVSVHGRTFAIPLRSVLEIVEAKSSALQTIGKHPVLEVRGTMVPLVWLGECYGELFPSKQDTYKVVIALAGGKPVGIVVDSFSGNQEFVIKNLGSFVGDLPGVSGATVLADGTLGLVLDVASFARSVEYDRNGVWDVKFTNAKT